MKVVITGANRGIGLEFVKQYLQRGCEVVAICRRVSDALAATSAKIIDGIDVSNDANIGTLANSKLLSDIDILINNAGILDSEVLGQINYATVERQLQVNALGPLKITEALINKMKNDSKVALITSRMGSVADNTSGGYYGYRMSKAALNAAGKSLAMDLKPIGIAVAILHPGFVQTDMVNHAGDISAETAAERLSQRIDELTIESSGTFWHSNGEVLPW